MKNLFRTLIALIAILSLACTALAEYKTPTTDYEVWQEYTPEQSMQEDVSGKAIAYQFTAVSDPETSKKNVSLKIDLYEDGFARMAQSTEGDGVTYYYYGYWTNMDDEEIFLAFTSYSYEGATIENMITHGDIRTVDYTYDLTEEDGTFTFGLNFCLGFADGGQYVRSTTATGAAPPPSRRKKPGYLTLPLTGALRNNQIVALRPAGTNTLRQAAFQRKMERSAIL